MLCVCVFDFVYGDWWVEVWFVGGKWDWKVFVEGRWYVALGSRSVKRSMPYWAFI